MLKGARLHLDADVDGDGDVENGVFDMSTGIELNPSIRTGKLIGNGASTAASVMNYFIDLDAGRAGFSLDAGGGAAVATISFQSFEGSDGRWGDGSGNDQADAEGDDVWRQISVLHQYLDVGTYDSRSPAVLEWGEHATDGVYDPYTVTPEEPSQVFDAKEETSVHQGDITLVSTRDVATFLSQQQNTK